MGSRFRFIKCEQTNESRIRPFGSRGSSSVRLFISCRLWCAECVFSTVNVLLCVYVREKKSSVECREPGTFVMMDFMCCIFWRSSRGKRRFRDLIVFFSTVRRVCQKMSYPLHVTCY